MTHSGQQTHPLTLTFADDGRIPNNPHLALLLYRAALTITGVTNPERLLVDAFTRNNWGNVWQNGIYPYTHYHSTTHEVLGVARGQATVRFGDERGKDVDLTAGASGGHGSSMSLGKPRFGGCWRLSAERSLRSVSGEQGGIHQSLGCDPARSDAGNRSGLRQGRTAHQHLATIMIARVIPKARA
jgi:hypothetical protein